VRFEAAWALIWIVDGRPAGGRAAAIRGRLAGVPAELRTRPAEMLGERLG
jgi:hypothetical protein